MANKGIKKQEMKPNAASEDKKPHWKGTQEESKDHDQDDQHSARRK